jgi:hypothetical protein
MRSYTIERAETIPDWNIIEKAAIDTINWESYTLKFNAYGQAAYVKNSLMIRLCACEGIPLARFEGLLDMVSKDSCLEFFLSPTVDGRYFSFEFNPKGTMYLGFGRDRNNKVRLVIPEYRDVFSIHPFSLENYWGIDFSISVSFINLFFPDFILEKGTVMHGNFFKCGDETEIKHYITWNPVESEKLSFHQPQYFGELLLG